MYTVKVSVDFVLTFDCKNKGELEVMLDQFRVPEGKNSVYVKNSLRLKEIVDGNGRSLQLNLKRFPDPMKANKD